ncbi:MAG: hypothetical protein RL095_900 [Verrucomicrobiota bacterium]|jgi:hypothetical protein
MGRRAFLAAGLAALAAGCSSRAPAVPDPQQDLYHLSWKGMKVGEARLSRRDETGLTRFAFDFHSSGALELIHPVHRQIEASASPDLQRSLSYRERGGKKTKSLDFDWPRGEIRRWRDMELRQTLPATSPCLDPLTLIYALRQAPLRPGRELRFLLTDGRKIAPVTASVEPCELEGRPGFLVRPKMSDLEGLLRLGDAEASLSLWIEDATARRLLRIDAGSPWGEIRAELQDAAR